MRHFIYFFLFIGISFSTVYGQRQDPLSDCEIYLDELDLQLKKDKKDTETYFQIQLEEGNDIFKKELSTINSNRERRELKKEYRAFVRNLEKDFNKEMDQLEDEYVEALEDAKGECGRYAIEKRLYRSFGTAYYPRRR
ncbi:MAG: hypothetical protein AAF696_21615 [Bacteroidota bacterium]